MIVFFYNIALVIPLVSLNIEGKRESRSEDLQERDSIDPRL